LNKRTVDRIEKRSVFLPDRMFLSTFRGNVWRWKSPLSLWTVLSDALRVLSKIDNFETYDLFLSFLCLPKFSIDSCLPREITRNNAKQTVITHDFRYISGMLNFFYLIDIISWPTWNNISVQTYGYKKAASHISIIIIY